jgi:electron transfer flavoprotein beta subunit
MGADRAFLIDSTVSQNEDPLVISNLLANFARKEKFDLIICGRQAIDDENANIGPMVAEILNIPHVNWITGLEVIDESRVRVESEIESGKRITNVVLPALFTAQKGLNEPRVPLITGVMKAMITEIPVVDPLTLGMSKDNLGENSSNTVVSPMNCRTKTAVKIMRISLKKKQEISARFERRSKGNIAEERDV